MEASFGRSSARSTWHLSDALKFLWTASGVSPDGSDFGCVEVQFK